MLRCEKAVDALKLEGDEKLGAKIIRNILEIPLRAIAENAGLDGAVVVNRVRQLKGKNDGYDADKDSYTIWLLLVSSIQPRSFVPR